MQWTSIHLAMKGPLTIVISTTKSAKQSVNKGVQTFSYHLSEQPLVFDEPHYVRLVHVVTPAVTTFIVACDFVASSPAQSPYPGFLGLANNSRSATNTWIPLASNALPAIGFLHIQSTSTTNPIVDIRNVTVVLEFAPESWLKHGSGPTISVS